MGSSNGTWLNRARLRPFIDVECQPGDVLAFGEPGLMLRMVAVNPIRQLSAMESALLLLPPLEVRSTTAHHAWNYTLVCACVCVCVCVNLV